MMANGLTISKPIQLIPPLDFGEFIIGQFRGNFDHAVIYLETVVRNLKSSRTEKEISIESIDEELKMADAQESSDSIVSVNEKFLSDKTNFVLNYGKKDVFMAGLESYIGRPKNPNILGSMDDEHNKSENSITEFRPPNNPQLLTTPAEEWLFVTNPAEYMQQAILKQRVILERRIVTVKELMGSEISTKAELTEAEVVAARLYTGPMFKLYNEILRNPQGPGRQSFVYTIHAFASCIVKLSRVHQISTLYRGIKGGALPSAFLNPDEYGARGGVEFGFMSTTTEKHVAYDYAIAKDGSAKKAAVIYEIDEGAIDRGADVSWLSQFPSENEVVFPPLTNLEVFGNPKVVDGAIVTKLRVNINLRTKTVDEIIDKSRTQFKDMLEWYYDEVKTADLGDCDPSLIFPSWLDDFSKFKDRMLAANAFMFNQQKFYREAVDDALDLKEGTVLKVHVLHLLSKLEALADIHNKATFKQTIVRLKRAHSSKFADHKFLRRYVELKNNSFDRDGNAALENYDLLWKLPLEKGSWVKMVRAKSSVPPLRVTTCRTFAQAVRDFVFWMGYGFLKGLWRQLIGFEAVDTLLGFDGDYYYVGLSTENGKPFYQLSRNDSSMSSKFLYFKGSRWYIGTTLGSETADVRTASEDDATPSNVRQWEKTTAPLLLAYIYSTIEYVPDELTSVRILDENSGSSFIQGVDEETGGNPLWNGTGMSSKELSTASRASRASRTSRVSRSTEANRDNVAITHEGEKWAFVHRIIEEQEMLSRAATGRNLDRSQTVAASRFPFAKAELHSIAVFCEQTNCPLPKEVNSCLRREGANAALASALLVVSIVCSVGMVAVLLIWLGSAKIGVLPTLRNEALFWYILGRVNSLLILGCVFWSALIVLLVGWTATAALGVACLIIGFGTIEVILCIAGPLTWSPLLGAVIAYTAFAGVWGVIISFLYFGSVL